MGWLRSAAAAAMVALFAVGSAAFSSGQAVALKLSSHTAVPGQVLVLSVSGAPLERASVTVGGKRATVLDRREGRLRVVVPSVKPGRRPLVLSAGGRRLTATLKLRRGFDGRLRPLLDRRSAASVKVGSDGGVVRAKGRDGTRFVLTIPAGALSQPTTVSLTPVRRLRDLNLSHRPAAVQFGPDGLQFKTPATLRITLKRKPRGRFANLVYDGSGQLTGIDSAKVSGRTLTLSISHFSGAAVNQMTPADFVVLVGQLTTKWLHGEFTLADALLFAYAEAFMSTQFGQDCVQDPTCAWLFGAAADDVADEAAKGSCAAITAGQSGSQLIEALTTMLDIDAALRLLGRNDRALQYQQDRLCVTRKLVDDVGLAALGSPLDTTHVSPISATDLSRADADSSGAISNCEWAIYVAHAAALQGFSAEEGRAIKDCEDGLRDVLNDGKAKCKEDFPAGHEILKKGDKAAEALKILFNEFADALSDCKPKITITPNPATVEKAKTLTFTVKSTDPTDTSFEWSVSGGGSIDASGQLTAPDTPGSLVVTAQSANHHDDDHKGTAAVEVVCPAGKENVNGQCVTVTLSVSPDTASLKTGKTQQFTATVTGTTDQRVTWFASCGSITAGGLYTAPQTQGPCTVQATSVPYPRTTGTASVTVALPGPDVTLDTRFADVSTDTRLAPQACPPGGESFQSAPNVGVWTLGPVTSACGSADQTSDLEPRADGQAWLHLQGSAQASSPPSRRTTLSESEHRIRFTVQRDTGVTLTCHGGFSASVDGANAGASVAFYLLPHYPSSFSEAETLGFATETGTVEFSRFFPQGTVAGLQIKVDAGTHSLVDVTATGAADVTCDFDGKVTA